MIKLNRNRCIRGQGYEAGDPYEGPEEAYMLKNGWADPVVADVPEAVEPEAEPVDEPAVDVEKQADPVVAAKPKKKRRGKRS